MGGRKSAISRKDVVGHHFFKHEGKQENILVPGSVKLLEPRRTNPEIIRQELRESRTEKLKRDG